MCHDRCSLNLVGRAAGSRSGVLLRGRFLGGGLLGGRGLLGSGVRLRSCGLLGRGVLRDGRGLRLGSRGRFGLRRGVLLRRGLLGFADRGDAQQRQRLAVTVATAIVVQAALLEDDDLFAAGLRDDLGRDGEALGEDRKSTSELQSLMRISYAVFCLKKKKTKLTDDRNTRTILE